MKRLQRLSADASGATLVEFALVLPIFLFMMLFTIDMGTMVLVSGEQDNTFVPGGGGNPVDWDGISESGTVGADGDSGPGRERGAAVGPGGQRLTGHGLVHLRQQHEAQRDSVTLGACQIAFQSQHQRSAIGQASESVGRC